MKSETMNALKTILSCDETISPDLIPRVISVMAGDPIDRKDFIRIIKINDAAKMLGVTRAGINDYIARGYLSKVVSPYGGTLGIRSDSLARFRHLRVVSKEPRA